jgi:hypothetical protein
MRAKNCALSLLAVMLFAGGAAAAEIRGVVVRVNAAKKELAIEGRGKGVRGMVINFAFNDDTQILIDKQPGKAADLVPGKRVRVSFDVEDGRRVARSITVHGAAAAQPALLPAPTDANAVAGTLRRVAYTDRELVLIHAGLKAGAAEETTVVVPEGARISRDQKPIRFEDLKEGEQAVVATEKKDGQLTAKLVQIGAAAPTNPPERGERRIERIRQILKMVDEVLQQIDKR